MLHRESSPKSSLCSHQNVVVVDSVEVVEEDVEVVLRVLAVEDVVEDVVDV